MAMYTVTSVVPEFDAIQNTGANFSALQTWFNAQQNFQGYGCQLIRDASDGETCWMFVNGAFIELPVNSWMMINTGTASGTPVYLANVATSLGLAVLDDATFRSIFTV